MPYYFRSDNDEECYSLASIREQMKDEDINELKVFEAKRETGTGYFYCKHTSEIGESGDCSNRICKSYIPNNGKNGRCKYYGYPYEQTDRSKIIKIINV
ncbi:MAG: hypothetical protein PHW73_00635 [Atribacterota bacterium]|nr:hypothetical protein [Atribacterota bacterium]